MSVDSKVGGEVELLHRLGGSLLRPGARQHEMGYYIDDNFVVMSLSIASHSHGRIASSGRE